MGSASWAGGGATEESYRLARQVAAGLAAGNGKTERVEFPEQKRLSVLQNIGGLGTRSWRVGGGRDEGDGGYSFLIRFLGRDRSVTGELYLRRPLATPAAADAGETNAVASETSAATETSGTGNVRAAVNASGPARWLVDDVLLEGPRSLAEGKYGPAGADMAAYERFF